MAKRKIFEKLKEESCKKEEFAHVEKFLDRQIFVRKKIFEAEKLKEKFSHVEKFLDRQIRKKKFSRK